MHQSSSSSTSNDNEHQQQHQQQQHQEEEDNKPGIWIGIDLGTSNCTAAYWDTDHNRSKLVRFRSPEYGIGGGSSTSRKGGRILPSYVAYSVDQIGDGGDGDGTNGNNVLGVGRGAMRYLEPITERSKDSDVTNDNDSEAAVVSSVKRIWGMSQQQIRSELELDGTFLTSLPFSSTLDFEKEANGDPLSTNGGGNDTNSNGGVRQQVEHESDGARIRIGGTGNSTAQLIPPLRVAAQLLRTIRTQSQIYLRQQRRKVSPLRTNAHGTMDTDCTDGDGVVRHCVIGVPAHFGRNRCRTIVDAARIAGFDGHVSTIVESTAAAMAYGLNVNVTAMAAAHDADTTDSDADADADTTANSNSKNGGRTVLVFDMGGGTTDVTIAQMIQPKDDLQNEPTFRVLATSGDRHLGGDDMDILLAQFLSTKFNTTTTNGNGGKAAGADWTQLRRTACRAKEELCGDGTPDHPQQESVDVPYGKDTYQLTHGEFSALVQPLVDRAARLVATTLSTVDTGPTVDTTGTDTAVIDEVILVGGATRTPSVPSMLHALFPSPIEFCSSIRGEKAVAQGAAIQSALKSGAIPHHVIRNATMLDVLPHPIGVLLTGSGGGTAGDEMYVPILERGTALPAMGYATFEPADADQGGVTIVAVEDVGEGFALERLGEFNFLLHRLSPPGGGEGGSAAGTDGSGRGGGGKRTIRVGMTVQMDGKLIVGVFDENDPEDLKKKEAYQEWKKKQKGSEAGGGDGDGGGPTYALGNGSDKGPNGDSSGSSSSREELLLTVGCLVLLTVYMSMKFLFHEVEEGSSQIL